MSTSTSSDSSRRPRRGGSRRPYSNNRQNNQANKPDPKGKAPGFFQKLLNLITGKSSTKATSSAAKKSGERPAARAKTNTRKLELREVTSPRLYVGNLSYDTAESDLTELFNGVGAVQSAEVVANRHTHRSKGFAFVQMQTMDEAKRAVEELHDKEFMGRKLVVSGARDQDSKED